MFHYILSYQAICTEARTQSSGWVDYQCTANPNMGGQSWNPNHVVIQYSSGIPNGSGGNGAYLLFESATGLLAEDANSFTGVFGQQPQPPTNQPQCLDLDGWDAANGFNMICECLEWRTDDPDQCAENRTRF